MKTDSKDKIVTLKTYNDLATATVAKSKLKANGIEAFLENENAVGLDPLGGVELKIFLRDLERANEIISE